MSSATRAANPHHVLVYGCPATAGIPGPLMFAVGETFDRWRSAETIALFRSRADAHQFATDYAAAHEAATGEELPIFVMPSAELP